jgi:hypothetical protein
MAIAPGRLPRPASPPDHQFWALLHGREVAWIAPFPLLGSGDPDASAHGRGGEAVDAAQGDGGLDPLAIVTARAGAGRSALLGAASRARRGRGGGRRSLPSRRRARPRRCRPPTRRLWGHLLASRWPADRGALARRDHRPGRRGRGWRHGRRSCHRPCRRRPRRPARRCGRAGPRVRPRRRLRSRSGRERAARRSLCRPPGAACARPGACPCHGRGPSTHPRHRP